VNSDGRRVIPDGRNAEEALRVLASQVPEGSIDGIRRAAAQVIELSVDPIAGAPLQPSDGLVYGMVQSGKTGVLTVAAAMAADNGFQGVIVLTADNDDLYEQTVERVRQALRGMTVLGKRDWRDANRFGRIIRVSTFALVCSKNAKMLHSLLEAFRNARARGLSLFIVDDEADQASLNTKARKPNTQPSPINHLISEIREYFPINTYLQVTATPQALFLQQQGHPYRPSFTVLTEPGAGYVGGDQFFGPRQRLLQDVDLAEVAQLMVGNQPMATGGLPHGLRHALCTFLVGAGDRLIGHPREGFAFLCHVSVSNRDHAHVLQLVDAFREEIVTTLSTKASNRYRTLAAELQAVHAELRTTEPALKPYSQIEDKVEFYIRGAAVKLINVLSTDDISLDSALNFFVGGNKLGRGVTIKNLLVSYYGRNPRRPNADTVLQHARMYGYRERDVGLTRLFLPRAIADNFRSIHDMDNALRELIRSQPNGRFEGLFLQNLIRGTRSNVVDPAAFGMYVAGRSYNPRMPLRGHDAAKQLQWLDNHLATTTDTVNRPDVIPFERAIEVLRHCPVDPAYGARLWNLDAISASLSQIVTVHNIDTAYLVVKRGRDLRTERAETQGILSGGEEALAPRDRPTLFIYRQGGRGGDAFWWPQLRFHSGNYALAFPFGA
jgi:hypothetical protein